MTARLGAWWRHVTEAPAILKPGGRTVAWLVLLAAPLFWSGPVRVVTGLGLWSAAALALVPTALAGLLLWRTRAAEPPVWPLARIAVAALPAAWALFLLYSRWFGGLPLIVDGDSGTHVAARDTFAASNPHEYNGFITFHTLTWWIERVRRHAFVSFALVYYLAVAATAALPPLAASATLDRLPPARRRAGLAVAVGATVLLVYFLFAPLLHYHQAEGFFPHVWTVPLLLIWFADGMLRPRALRVATLLLGVIAYRYSYGLNLGDLLLAAAALCLFELRGAGARARAILPVLSLGLAAAGVYAHLRLRPVFALDGWIIPHDHRQVLLGQALLVAALVSLPASRPARAALDGSDLSRWLRLPILFGAMNAIVCARLLLAPPLHAYYQMKYSLHAVILLGAATVVALTVVVGHWPAGKAARLALALPLLLALVGLTVTVRGFAAYRPSFLERAFGRPPFRQLHPLADLGAWPRIERVLRDHRAKFGGYLVTFYPLMSFMNAAFGYYNDGIHFYYGRPAIEAPGHCTFWEGGTAANWLEPDFPQRGRRATWDRDPEKACIGYPAHWNPQIHRTLCWRCR